MTQREALEPAETMLPAAHLMRWAKLRKTVLTPTGIPAPSEDGTPRPPLWGPTVPLPVTPAPILQADHRYSLVLRAGHMDPVCKVGDTLDCEPCRAVRIDDDYLMETGTQRHLVLVRIYGQTRSTWKALTYTPAVLFDLPKAEWRPVFRIVAVHYARPRPKSKWDGTHPEALAI
jgi:hypothetical protein